MAKSGLQSLKVLLADEYSLYLKTQNYHWHVRGPNFYSIHKLLEKLYRKQALNIDDLAERIVTLGSHAPATFQDFEKLCTIKHGDSSQDVDDMVKELVNDFSQLIKDLKNAIEIAQEQNDEGSVQILGEQLAQYEKFAWMLRSTM